jgi:DNA-directed RNA polymerase subunit K/omega
MEKDNIEEQLSDDDSVVISDDENEVNTTRKTVKKKSEDDEESEDEDDEDDEDILDVDEPEIKIKETDEEEDDEDNSEDETENMSNFTINEDFEDDEEYDEEYYQKLNTDSKQEFIKEHHPELITHNDEEVKAACVIKRDEDGIIVDPFHKTIPLVTKYEKAQVLGVRSNQLNQGATPFVDVEPNIIDGYLIALKEFEEKKIPFIISRPLPNGTCEYWKLSDLELI